MQFRNDIQGLRALAFLLVFIFHLNSSWLPGGFLGVDLFFVISGYLITTITLSDIERGKFSFGNFFIKRIKRIVPAYFALLCAVSFAGSYIYLFTDISTLMGTVLRSALFISNKLFANGNSYFGAQLSENPLLHTWSLAIEMQFYIILPLLLWFFRNKLRVILPLIIIATTAYSTYHLYALDNKSAMYFSLTARIPEFLVGAYAAVLFKEGLNFKRILNNLLACISLVVLLLCAFFINEASYFPGYLALIPCIASGVLLVLKNNAMSDFFSRRIPVYIGEMSYSLYLWHWPVLAFLRYINDSYTLQPDEIIFVIVFTFILSWFSYTFVEKNFRRISTKKAFLFLCSGGVVLAVAYLIMPLIAEKNKIPDLYTQPLLGLKSHNENRIEKFGDLSKTYSIILIGDSNALMLKPFLNKIGMKNKFSFYTLTTDSFPTIRGIKRSEVGESSINYFNESLKLIPKTDSLVKSNKIIILNISRADKLPSMQTAISDLARGLTSDQKLILIATFPTVRLNPIKVKTTIFRKQANYDHVFYHPKSQKLLKDIASSYSNVYYYDISKSKVFKNAPFINDTVAYYNADHINHYGSLKLAADIGEDFNTFLQSIRK